MTELPPDKARDFAGFTRLQVVAIRREAWSGLHDDGHRYYFDGDRFWRLAGSAPDLSVAPSAVPFDGWLHANDCCCNVCRWFAPQSGEPSREGERP